MNFQIAFHKYASFLREKLQSHSFQHEWVCEELSSTQPDGSWKLVGMSDTVVAQVWPDGTCELKLLDE